METWANFISRFSQGYQGIIGELIDTYRDVFGISDYFVFAQRPVEQMASELSTLPGENAFIAHYADVVVDQSEILSFDDQPPVDRLNDIIGELSVQSIIEAITGENPDKNFWLRFAYSIKLREFNQTTESLNANFNNRIASKLSIGLAEFIEVVNGPTGYPIIDLSNFTSRQFIAQASVITNPADDPLRRFVALVAEKTSAILAEGYSEKESFDVLVNSFPFSFQAPVRLLIESIRAAQPGTELKFDELAETQNILDKLNNNGIAWERQPFVHELANSYISEAALFIKEVFSPKFIERPANYWQTITFQLLNNEERPLVGWLVTIVLPGSEDSFSREFQTQGSGRFAASLPRAYNAQGIALSQVVSFEVRTDFNDEEPEIITSSIGPDDKFFNISLVNAKEVEVPVEETLLSTITSLLSNSARLANPTPVLAAINDLDSDLRITTLEHIRAAGGLKRILFEKEAGLHQSANLEPLANNPELVKTLDAHANLQKFSGNLEINDYAITVLADAGLEEIGDLTQLSREEFVTAYELLTRPAPYYTASPQPGEEERNAYLDAAELYHKAQVSKALESTLNGIALSSQASGYVLGDGDAITSVTTGVPITWPAAPPLLTSTVLEEIARNRCDCDSCSTAVSPLAYLAALLQYAQQYLRLNGNTVTVATLEQTFAQPFCELGTTCAQSEEKVCQTRIAVATLIQYLRGGNTSVVVADSLLEGYLDTVYSSLLQGLGTSVPELTRATQASDPTELARLAGKIGVEAADLEQLSDLLSSSTSSRSKEEKLELSFGLKTSGLNTSSNAGKLAKGYMAPMERLSGPQIGVAYPERLTHWAFKGELYGINTDEEGFIYLQIIRDTTIVTAHKGGWVKVFKQYSTSSEWLATGIITAAKTGTNTYEYFAELFPINDSGLSGKVVINNAFGAGNENEVWCKVSLFPAVTAARLNYLEKRWQTEDNELDNPYFNHSLPIVDPDLMSPDDIREPQVINSPGSAAYNLWKHRMLWLEQLVFNPADNLETLIDNLKLTVQYTKAVMPGAPAPLPFSAKLWDLSNLNFYFRDKETGLSDEESGLPGELDDITPADIFTILESGEYSRFEGIRNYVLVNRELFLRDVLRLTESQAARLHKLYQEEKTKPGDPLPAPVEALNILRSIAKRAFSTYWVTEETGLNLELYPDAFYPALNAPKTGVWNQEPDPSFQFLIDEIPFIDPQFHSVTDLPDPVWGGEINTLWSERNNELIAKRSEIRNSINVSLNAANGGASDAWDAAWNNAFNKVGEAQLDITPFARFDLIPIALREGSGPDYIEAIKLMDEEYRMHPDDFLKLVDLKEKAENPLQTINESEWNALVDILVKAWKYNNKYEGGEWYDQETASPFISSAHYYWMFYKQKLVEHRATSEARQLWEAALQKNSARPIIDPDQLGPGDFRNPQASDPAFELYSDRLNSSVYLPAPSVSTGFATGQLDMLGKGFTKTDLQELLTLHEAGADISRRLAQLTLTIPALKVLVDFSKLTSAQVTAAPDYKKEVENILIQVRKLRQFGEWQKEERELTNNGLVLSHRYFVRPYPSTGELNSYLSEILIPWRSSLPARREWQNKLATRGLQYENIVDSMRQSVKAAEEIGMPLLRDMLIENKVTFLDVHTFDKKAKRLSERLLLDFKVSCCQQTTRIALAIEVVQKLFFLMKNNLLDTELLDFTSVAGDRFDQDWKWLGSYERWRSLMFVYLYPENMLLPTARPVQTEKFRRIIGRMREQIGITASDACSILKEFEFYLEDISNLKLQSAVRTYTRNVKEDCEVVLSSIQQVNYQFALSRSKKIFYNAYKKPQFKSEHYVLWNEVPLMVNVDYIIGSTVFRNDKNERFVYVFAVMERLKQNEEDAKKTPPDSNEKIIAAQRFNLETQQWNNELIEIESKHTWTSDDNPRFTETEYLSQCKIILAERKTETEPLVICGHIKLWRSVLGDSIGLTTYGEDYDLYNHDLWHIVLDSSGTGNEGEQTKNYLKYVHHIDLLACIVNDNKVDFCFLVKQLAKDINSSSVNSLWHLFQLTGSEIRVKTYGVHPTYFKGLINTQYWLTDHYNQYDTKVNNPPGLLTSYQPIISSIVNISSVITNNFKFVGYTTNDSAGKKINFIFSYYHIYYTYSFDFNLLKDLLVDDPNSNSPSTSDLLIKGTPTDDYDSSWTIGQASGVSNGILSYVGPCYQYMDISGQGATLVPVNLVYQTVSASGIPSDILIHLGGAPHSLSLPSAKFYPLVSELSSSQQAVRKGAIAQLFSLVGNSSINKIYMQEAYYFLPLHIAIELQKSKLYEEALHYLRLIYDFELPYDKELPNDKCRIYYGLEAERSINDSSSISGWFSNPDSPHTIAQFRSNSYTRYTIFNIVQCLLGYADQEFTRDTAESVPRARELYELALELLAREISEFENQTCEELADQLDVLVTDNSWRPEWYRLKSRILHLNDRSQIVALLQAIGSRLSGSGDWLQRLADVEGMIDSALSTAYSYHTSLCHLLASGNNIVVNTTLEGDPDGSASTGRIRLLAQEAGTDFRESVKLISDNSNLASYEWLSGTLTPTAPVTGALAKVDNDAFSIYELDITGTGISPFVPFGSYFFCVPRNPVAYYLRLYTELNLYKIRSCRNIAGMERQLDPYAAPTDATSGLPMIGVGGQLMVSGPLTLPPTQYRYHVLLDRAKQLVGIAQQIEASMLSTLEKRDAESYGLMKARQDVSLGRQSVRLQDLRIKEAEGGIKLAELQKERSELMRDNYQGWVDAGINKYEQNLLEAYSDINRFTDISIKFDALSQIAHMGISAAGAGVGAGVAAGLWALAGTYVIGKLALDIAISDSNYAVSFNSFYASHQRSLDEWTFQASLATQDIKIGDQQINLAEDRLRIVGQERRIADLQLTHAEDVVNFLRTKFTNEELYRWMSGVLQQVYAYFLQQATATARLAELQLSFERQEPVNLIQGDYWAPPADGSSYGQGETNNVNRKGLTGSVRLLQDITKLDQQAFSTNKRKLQLTKTLSLATLFPAEFAYFRQTGRLPFATMMEWFDRDFPGHYQRIIRKVRTSVIALIPPVEGIKAKLQTTGVSTVVLGGVMFREVRMPRNPESVSYTSPQNATGLFEMEQQPGEMLYPFEGMGVAALWEFSMELAANRMDFQTIADVLITIEYTSLESFDYRSRLLLEPHMDTSEVVLERTFSLKNDFADQWYDLHHLNDLNATGIEFPISKTDFPKQLRNLSITGITLLLSIDDELSTPDQKGNGNKLYPVFEVELNRASNLTVAGKTGLSNTYGVISTKTGNNTLMGQFFNQSANDWSSLMGQLGATPETWVLKPSSTGQGGALSLRDALQADKVLDIILILQVSGVGPKYQGQ